jgi:hypothetical protein
MDATISALVRISGERGGTPVRGSGFVVGLDRDKATIVTAAHVIEGVAQISVTFAADPFEHFPAGEVLGMEAGDPHGLAVFQVRGELSQRLVVLSFDTESRPAAGMALFLLGFPQAERAPRTTQRVLSARRGKLLLVDQEIGEGYSGGPVLRDGKVVGVITATDDQTTYAVNAVVTREALEGWGIPLGRPVTGSPSPPPSPQEKRSLTFQDLRLNKKALLGVIVSNEYRLAGVEVTLTGKNGTTTAKSAAPGGWFLLGFNGYGNYLLSAKYSDSVRLEEEIHLGIEGIRLSSDRTTKYDQQQLARPLSCVVAARIEPADASVYLDGEFIGTGRELLKTGLRLKSSGQWLAVVRPEFQSSQVELNEDECEYGVSIALSKR